MVSPTATWNKTTPAHNDPMIAYALNRIEREYGDTCIVNRKDLDKFGGNPLVGTSEVSINSWGEDEVFQTSNVTLKISSTSPSDVADVTVESMRLDEDGFTFEKSTVTLNGQNKVDLILPAARWTRLLTDDQVAGDVLVYRDTSITGGAPDDLTFVHNHIPAGENQSQKAGTTIAKNNYFLLDGYWADIIKKSNASAKIKFKERLFGGEFRTVPRRGVSESSSLIKNYRSPRIILPSTDILITAESSVTGTDVTAGFTGFFADIVKSEL